MTALISALLVSIASQAEPVRIDLAGYAPSYLPPVLNKRAPKKSEALTCSTRGYRDIAIEWEIRMPQEHMELELKEGFKVSSLGPGDTGEKWLVLQRSDRCVLITTSPGRLVRGRGEPDGSPSFYMGDQGSFTTVNCVEYVLPVGPLPKDWPDKAKQAIPIPKDAPKLPIPGFDSPPDEVEFSNSFGTWYSLTWHVNVASETAYPKWLKSIEGQADWKVTPDKYTTEIVGKGPKAGQTITLYHYINTKRPVPPEWSGITFTWQVKPPKDGSIPQR